MRSFLRPALAGLVLAALTGACGKESIAPKSLANPQATTAQLASLDTIFNAAPLRSFSAVSGSIQPTAPAPMPALALAAAVTPLTESPELRPYARRILGARTFGRLLPQLSVRAMAALFPVDVVGGTPVYVNYTVTIASQSFTSAQITTAGYITNGASSPDSVRFNGTVTASGSQTNLTVTEDVSFDVNSRDIHVRNWQRVTLTQSTLSLKISFRFEHGGEVVTLDGTLDVDETTGTVSGTITSKVDGGQFATCTVDGTSTSFTLTCSGADQDGLNADEQEALHNLGDATESIGAMFEGILSAAIGVLGA